jgi:hypothetical protein
MISTSIGLWVAKLQYDGIRLRRGVLGALAVMAHSALHTIGFRDYPGRPS